MCIRDSNWGAGANNHRFAFLITDEDIDLTKDTPTKEATLKALQDAGISLTVVGETAEKKDLSLIHILTTIRLTQSWQH